MRKRGTLLLTGGSGMVGRNIQDHPLAAEWDILAPRSRALDLTDAAAVSAFMDRHRPDMVIHAAGRVGGIQANIRHPVAFLEENTAMGRNVIMAARQAGVTRILNLASTCMYPRAAENPLREEMILSGELEPTNEGYALAKIFATRLCQYIRREDEAAQYKTLIPCNLYGLHDKFDPAHSHLVPAIIHKMHIAKTEGQETVEIWGDGTARREFMFAADLAEAVLRAAAAILKGKKIAPGIRALIVPGSGLVRAQAEEEGLAEIFIEAGCEWRLAGCSMCLAMNPDQLSPGERCAATSNRNFEGRQGRGGRTHLLSPAMAAAAAVTGRLTDVRELM